MILVQGRKSKAPRLVGKCGRPAPCSPGGPRGAPRGCARGCGAQEPRGAGARCALHVLRGEPAPRQEFGSWLGAAAEPKLVRSLWGGCARAADGRDLYPGGLGLVAQNLRLLERRGRRRRQKNAALTTRRAVPWPRGARREHGVGEWRTETLRVGWLPCASCPGSPGFHAGRPGFPALRALSR